MKLPKVKLPNIKPALKSVKDASVKLKDSAVSYSKTDDAKAIKDSAVDNLKEAAKSDAGKCILGGAAAGAVICAVLPVVGPVIGAQVGAAVGAYKHFTK